jgi:hypothetical protein
MSAFTPKAPQALQAAVELKDLPRGLAQNVGLFFYSLLKCLKRFIVLLPDAALRVADDLRTRADLSLSYDAIANRREYGFPKSVHHYKWTSSQPAPSMQERSIFGRR